MALTDSTAKNAKAKGKPYKLSDEKGMYLLVTATGAKWWRFKFRFAGKEKQLSLGVYRETSLREARDRRDAAIRQPPIRRPTASVWLWDA